MNFSTGEAARTALYECPKYNGTTRGLSMPSVQILRAIHFPRTKGDEVIELAGIVQVWPAYGLDIRNDIVCWVSDLKISILCDIL